MSSERAPFLDVSTVAGMLRWHPQTVREHLIPLGDWQRGSTSIPSMKLGARYFIPRWWVEEVIAAGRNAPEPAQQTKEAGGVQKSRKF